MSLDDELLARVCEGLTAQDVGPVCLVTGGAGYLGQHLVQALVHLGCTVRTLDVVAVERSDVDARVGDVRDPAAVRAACEGVDTVFHAAAAMAFAGLVPPEVRARIAGINVQGTRTVLAAAREAGVSRLVATSTANVVIDRELVEVGEEVGYATRFVDVYGETKAEAERLVRAADTPGGLRTCALRPGGIWGPGAGGYMIQAFVDQLAQGAFVATIGDGRAVVDNTHVASLARAELLAARALLRTPGVAGGKAWFITDDERLNGITWFRPLAEGLGFAWPRWSLPASLAYLLAWASEVAYARGGPEPVLTRIGILKLTRSSAFKVDGARRDLGYEPLISSADGLARHLDDHKEILEARKRPRRTAHGLGERTTDGLVKVLILVTDPQGRGRTALREVLLEEVAPDLLTLGAERLSVLCADEAADVPSPSPFPLGPSAPRAVVNAWVREPEEASRLTARLEQAGLQAHAWQVAESVYRTYGDNAHAAPRSWPDGERSPGVTAVSLLRRPARLDPATWLERWFGTMSPVSEAIQPRTRYVRNYVLRPLTPGAPPLDGLVEEAWPSPRHVTDPWRFYGAGNPLTLARNMGRILWAVQRFTNVWTVRTVMMSEWFVRT